jgi:hypothetical protein
MRWHVAQGGYPHGWESPFLKTDDANEAMRAYEEWTPQHMMTVAIFDDQKGEGAPLDPHAVEEILDQEYEDAA